MSKPAFVEESSAPPPVSGSGAFFVPPDNLEVEELESAVAKETFAHIFEEIANLIYQKELRVHEIYSSDEEFDAKIKELLDQAVNYFEDKAGKITGIEDFDPSAEFDESEIFAIYQYFKENSEGLDEEEERKIFADILTATSGKVSQVVVNSFFRQIASNVKIVLDAGSSVVEHYKGNLMDLPKGFVTRAITNLFGIGVGSAFADHLREKGSGTITQALGAASIDTAVGTAPELKAARGTLSKTVAKKIVEENLVKTASPSTARALESAMVPFVERDIARKMPSMVIAALPLYFSRNYSSWVGAAFPTISEDSKAQEIMGRMLIGFFGGAISTLFDTPANLVNRKIAEDLSSGSAFQDALNGVKAVCKDIAAKPQEFLKLCAKGAPTRSVATALSAVLMSKDGRTFFVDMVKQITADFSALIRDEGMIKAFEIMMSNQDPELQGEVLDAEIEYLESFIASFAKELTDDPSLFSGEEEVEDKEEKDNVEKMWLEALATRAPQAADVFNPDLDFFRTRRDVFPATSARFTPPYPFTLGTMPARTVFSTPDSTRFMAALNPYSLAKGLDNLTRSFDPIESVGFNPESATRLLGEKGRDKM